MIQEANVDQRQLAEGVSVPKLSTRTRAFAHWLSEQEGRTITNCH